jgi:hypothetical protein
MSSLLIFGKDIFKKVWQISTNSIIVQTKEGVQPTTRRLRNAALKLRIFVNIKTEICFYCVFDKIQNSTNNLNFGTEIDHHYFVSTIILEFHNFLRVLFRSVRWQNRDSTSSRKVVDLWSVKAKPEDYQLADSNCFASGLRGTSEEPLKTTIRTENMSKTVKIAILEQNI